ncbi:MAG: LicD family protein [Clostridia bacterium]|nr:LicD family protein [Clostridia bacterium]
MPTIKDVQKVELDILKAVVQVCDKHNIDYYLAFGTMLGAVRHKGFIPWDDDIDIYVMQKDMRRLKKACLKELPKKYFWQDQQTDRSVPQLYKKVRNINTEMYGSRTDPEVEKRKENQQGIWIDIMPLFRAAKSKKLYNLQIKLMIQYQFAVIEQRKLHLIKGKNLISTFYMKLRELFFYRPVASIIFAVMLLLQSKKSHQWLHFGLHSIIYRTEFETVEKIATDNLLSDDIVSKKAYYDFEGERFSGFADYNSYLVQSYGPDYMTPIKRSHVENYDNVIIKDTELDLKSEQ